MISIIIIIPFLFFITESACSQEPKDSLTITEDTILIQAIKVEAYQVSLQLRTIPGGLSVLSNDRINIADGTNLADALSTLPGINMQNGTYTTNRIVIRGMGSRTPYNTNRIKTYINEIPITSSDGLSSPEEIDVQSMGRLELIKGPSSSLYGSGLGGSMNIYTPQYKKDELLINGSFGSYNTWRTNFSGNFRSGKATALANLSQLNSDGYRENSQYRRTNIMSTIKWDQPGRSVELLLLFTRVHSGIPSSVGKTQFENEPQKAAENWKEIDGYKKYFRGISGITLSHKINNRITNKLTAFGKGTDSYERRPFNNLDDLSLSVGLREKLTLHWDKSDVIAGTEWISEVYSWELDTNNIRINRNRERRNQINIFAILYYHPVSRLNILLAGALNYVTYRLEDRFLENGEQTGKSSFPLIFSPRIGINYSPYNQMSIYASAGHGFSLPSPEETLLPEGDLNPLLKHEQGFQYELGTRLNLFRNRLGIEGTLYWIELSDLLVTKRISEDIFTGINAGKSRHQGIELLINGQLLNRVIFPGKLSTSFSYTHTLNRFLNFTDEGNNYDNKSLPGIPRVLLYFQLEWVPITRLTIDINFRYTGRQYLDDSNTLVYHGYPVTNAKFSLCLLKEDRLKIYMGVNNIMDTPYASMLIVNARGFNGNEPRFYYPGLPRNFYGGLQFKL
jgi:iron complex outermembrane receptor protein